MNSEEKITPPTDFDLPYTDRIAELERRLEAERAKVAARDKALKIASATLEELVRYSGSPSAKGALASIAALQAPEVKP